MARDYKYRAHSKSGRLSAVLRSTGFWQWMLFTASVILLAVLIVYWRTNRSGPAPAHMTADAGLPVSKRIPVNTPADPAPSLPERPHFDFYQILLKKEVIVADHEIPTRSREEHLGKAKDALYFMQAGSFKTYPEADQQKARLGLLGIESKVLKGKVGNDVWYRVKIGPYNHINSVNAIKNRLRQNGIDVLVTETGE
jgi:cell division protein FtsN